MQLTWKGASKDARELIEMFEAEGWTFRLSNSNHAIGSSPEGVHPHETVSIPQRVGPNRTKQNAIASLRRWKRERDAEAAMDRLLPVAGALLDREGEDEVVDGILRSAAAKWASAAMPALLASDSEVTIVSEKPWMARMGTSRRHATTDLYESETTIEVTWSDGTTSYRCSLAGCDFEADKPHSVASHYRGHVRSGEAEPVTKRRVAVAADVPIAPESIGSAYPGKSVAYEPSDRLIDALSEWLNSRGIDTVEQAAKNALLWLHERPDLGDPEDREREPLTDTQIVERIRRLVGGRDPETEEALRNALATVDRLQQAYGETLSQVAALEQELADVKAKRDALQSDIDAWIALAPRT